MKVLVTTSIATATFDTLVAVLAVSGAVDEAADGFVRLFAVVLVVMLLSTALVPLMRRVGGVTSPEPGDAFGRRPASQGDASGRRPASQGARLTSTQLADEVAAIAERLDTFDASPSVRREAQTLRDLVARATARND
jgi:hypothetical protein